MRGKSRVAAREPSLPRRFRRVPRLWARPAQPDFGSSTPESGEMTVALTIRCSSLRITRSCSTRCIPLKDRT